MIFFIDKVNLSIQFQYHLLIVLLEVLHRQFFIVLTTLVKLTKSQDFSVANFYTFFKLIDSLLQCFICFLQIFAPLSDFVGSFIRTSQLLSPFLVTNRRSSSYLLITLRRGVFTLAIFTVQLVVHL